MHWTLVCIVHTGSVFHSNWIISVEKHHLKQTDTTLHGKTTVRTVTFHALVNQPVEQGAAVVAESRAGIRVDLELVFTSRILQGSRHRDRFFIHCNSQRYQNVLRSAVNRLIDDRI